MNRDRAKELLPIIQAFADGEDVQFKTMERDRDWQPAESMSFSVEGFEYRIKPKPREFWVYDGNDEPIISTTEVAEAYKHKWFKVIEVIDA